MDARATSPIPVASRIGGFVYAIRNIVTEARKVEAAGRRVRYLNIGDPITFGFETPQHLIEAVDRAIRAGQNGYAPSVGILAAREAVAAECDRRGMPVSPDRVVITSGTSEGIELALTALAEAGDEVLIPVPTYPLYTAVLAKIGARAVFYRTDPDRGWMPDLEHVRSLITPATRALVVIDPNNPTGATYPVEIRRALVELADRHNFPLLADEVYADLAFDGPVPAIAAGYPDAPVITFSSLSKAYLAPGWRAGWMAVSSTPRLDDALGAIKKLADGRLCATGPMEHAIAAALNGDRSHQVAFRAALQVRAERHHEAPERHRRDQGRRAHGRLLRHAARRRCRRARPTRTMSSDCCARPASSASTARGSARSPRTVSSASSSSPRPRSCRASTTTSPSSRGTFLRNA